MRRIARVISDLILMKEKVFGLAQKVRDRTQNSELRTRRATFEGGILLGLIHRHGSFNQSAINHSLQQTKNENMSSSTKHELLYFDGAGRAETIRIALHAGGVDFTDTRFGKDWPTIKPTTPLGSVPVLKVDGVMHCQSVALARYAGKLGGFYPEDPVQALIVDEAIESLNELMAVAPKRYERVHAETTILFVFYKKVMILICSAHKTENICPPLSHHDICVIVF